VTVIAVIATLVVPNLIKSKAAANEASAMQSLINLVNAQLNYSVTRGSGRFAAAVGILSNVGLIDDVLGSGTKNGYSFVISTGASNTSFNIVAKPVTFGTTGNRYFCSDEDSVIYVSIADDCSTMTSAPIGTGGKKKGKK
jgi:type II secretory pathway pseudopilin PulG